MIILIWIQTGFAMVILSAALRGVPEETLEAARIDGASGFRIFFDIMIPQIWGTIIVVWTTITITVLKVFDIVYAMTNGEFQTQVLANYMYRWMFISGDYGKRLDHRGDHHAGGDPDHGLEHPPRQRRAGDALMTSIATTPEVAQSQPMGLPKVNVGRLAAHLALLLPRRPVDLPDRRPADLVGPRQGPARPHRLVDGAVALDADGRRRARAPPTRPCRPATTGRSRATSSAAPTGQTIETYRRHQRHHRQDRRPASRST